MKYTSLYFFIALLLALPHAGFGDHPYNPLNDQFLRAVSAGDLQQAKDSLAKGADINAQGINGDFALEEAINLGNTEMFQWLIGKGANVNLKDDFGDTPLISAAKNDRIEVIQPLLAKKADVHAQHDAALMTAVDHQQMEIIKALLAAGADANAKNEDGQSILMHAVAGPRELLQAILDAGAKLDANAADNNGVTILMYAAGGCDVQAMQFLLAKGADIKTVDHDGNTVLLRLPLNSFGEAAGGIPEAVKFLVAQGIDINAKNSAGDTALLHAVHQYVTEAGGTMAHANVVEALLTVGADIKAKDAQGNTPLHLILKAIPSNPEVANILIRRGSDVAAANSDGQTPLMIAAQTASVEIVRMLLSKHVDRNVQTKDGATALSLAQKARARAGITEKQKTGLTEIISMLQKTE